MPGAKGGMPALTAGSSQSLNLPVDFPLSLVVWVMIPQNAAVVASMSWKTMRSFPWSTAPYCRALPPAMMGNYWKSAFVESSP